MSSPTLELMIKHWGGKGSVLEETVYKLPFNVELFCREMDDRIKEAEASLKEFTSGKFERVPCDCHLYKEHVCDFCQEVVWYYRRSLKDKEESKEMKTKEYEVLINQTVIQRGGVHPSGSTALPVDHEKSREDGWLKAKLIIELPEKKIEITESQFDGAVYDIFHNATLRGDGYELIKDKLKEKIFGINND